MIIEKINENQIKCTLTNEELQERHLQISELAYGGDKAKLLLEEMMAKASEDLGFNISQGCPLMIEATANEKGITLLITKINEEIPNENSVNTPSKKTPKPLEDFLLSDEFLSKLSKLKKNIKSQNKTKKESLNVRIYTFYNFSDLISAAKALSNIDLGLTSLYKNERTNEYVLVTHRSDLDVKKYIQAGNMLCEFGVQLRADGPSLAFLEEHCKIIIPKDVFKQLANM